MGKIDEKLENLTAIGPKYAAKLKALGIETVRDMLYHFPFRYEDLSLVFPIGEAKVGQLVTLVGKIKKIRAGRTHFKKMPLVTALFEDKSGTIKIVWFNQPFIGNNIKEGDELRVSGKLASAKDGVYLANPVYEKASRVPTNAGRIVPVYPETRGITSKWLRWKISDSIQKHLREIEDLIPPAIAKRQQLMNLHEAIRELHFPSNFSNIEKARKRLAFEEMFFIQLIALRAKNTWNQSKAISIPIKEKQIKSFVSQLPFKLTNAQKKAAWEILKDLEKSKPMNRLLEGDVGSGKTVVAAIASLSVLNAGFQTAILTPTEVLARQHFDTFSQILKKFSRRIGLLTASERRTPFAKNTLKNFLGKIRRGELSVIIGTHALLEDKVTFKNLALVIVDEQHRFGVEQRAKLQKTAISLKDGLAGKIPHLLSMTATPIPRTLAIAYFGNLDVSILDEMPRGRKKIETKFAGPQEKKAVWNFIKKELRLGRQAFIIYPLIEKSEKIDARSAIKEKERLEKEIFPEFKIGLLHGRMRPKEKEEVMKRFKERELDILVSTSVIEVGVDVPNATVMVIENAERFGLAQLHQFRGRVGRGKYQSYCFLMSDSDLAVSSRRLKALEKYDDGFKLAEIDLEIRGPGEFIGTRQSGLADTTMSYLGDVKLIQAARLEAQSLIAFDPKETKFPKIWKKVQEKEKKAHFE